MTKILPKEKPRWWDKQAIDVQSSVRGVESGIPPPYSAPKTRMAVIHTREDVVLLVSHLSSANLQLPWIVKLLMALLVILVVIAFELWR